MACANTNADRRVCGHRTDGSDRLVESVRLEGLKLRNLRTSNAEKILAKTAKDSFAAWGTDIGKKKVSAVQALYSLKSATGAEIPDGLSTGFPIRFHSLSHPKYHVQHCKPRCGSCDNSCICPENHCACPQQDSR